MLLGRPRVKGKYLSVFFLKRDFLGAKFCSCRRNFFFFFKILFFMNMLSNMNFLNGHKILGNNEDEKLWFRRQYLPVLVDCADCRK